MNTCTYHTCIQMNIRKIHRRKGRPRGLGLKRHEYMYIPYMHTNEHTKNTQAKRKAKGGPAARGLKGVKLNDFDKKLLEVGKGGKTPRGL